MSLENSLVDQALLLEVFLPYPVRDLPELLIPLLEVIAKTVRELSFTFCAELERLGFRLSFVLRFIHQTVVFNAVFDSELVAEFVTHRFTASVDYPIRLRDRVWVPKSTAEPGE